MRTWGRTPSIRPALVDELATTKSGEKGGTPVKRAAFSDGEMRRQPEVAEVKLVQAPPHVRVQRDGARRRAARQRLSQLRDVVRAQMRENGQQRVPRQLFQSHRIRFYFGRAFVSRSTLAVAVPFASLPRLCSSALRAPAPSRSAFAHWLFLLPAGTRALVARAVRCVQALYYKPPPRNSQNRLNTQRARASVFPPPPPSLLFPSVASLCSLLQPSLNTYPTPLRTTLCFRTAFTP